MKRTTYITLFALICAFLPISVAAGCYRFFYEQLTDEEKLIYDAFAKCDDLLQVTKENALVVPVSGNGTAIVTLDDYNNGQWHPKSASVYSQLDVSRVRALDAFALDDSENYWIAGNDGVVNFSFDFVNASDTRSKKAPVRVSVSDMVISPYPYYEEIKKETAAVAAALDKMEDALAGKLSVAGSRYDSVRIIHDGVAALATYDWKNVISGHTLTGILLEKYGHKSVCDGYAKLFKLLCDRFDIPCIKVTGVAKIMKVKEKTMVEGPHIWNNVLMDDGRWYLVDVTWDDMMTETSGKLCSDSFLAGMDDVDCFGMTIASHYRSTGVMSGGAPYKRFSLPVVSKRGYRPK